MNPIRYLKEKGIKHAFDVIYRYKIDRALQKILMLFLRHKPLKDIIMIESHNDFDCNGGAFYDYLIAGGYHKKYKIVWQLKHKCPKQLPKQVKTVRLYRPSLRKAYYKCTAKYFLYDCECQRKARADQISIYCTHGPISLKNCKGLLDLPESISYCLAASEESAPLLAHQINWDYPNDKFIYVGYPMHDTFYQPPTGELKKLTDRVYKKVILWMPTFRKGGGFRRNDSTVDQPLGIPLIERMQTYEELNELLASLDCLLIIKIHPMQDMDDLLITDRSHIKVLTGESVKTLGIDNYRLMKETDAMISDYSSAAFDYLHLNKPIAYMRNDEKTYKLGYVVDDPRTLMAGDEIYTFEDLTAYIKSVSEDKDTHKARRQALFDRLFTYHDGNSSKRLAEFMGLEI